jgi:hypothetical protein
MWQILKAAALAVRDWWFSDALSRRSITISAKLGIVGALAAVMLSVLLALSIHVHARASAAFGLYDVTPVTSAEFYDFRREVAALSQHLVNEVEACKPKPPAKKKTK